MNWLNMNWLKRHVSGVLGAGQAVEVCELQVNPSRPGRRHAYGQCLGDRREAVALSDNSSIADVQTFIVAICWRNRNERPQTGRREPYGGGDERGDGRTRLITRLWMRDARASPMIVYYLL